MSKQVMTVGQAANVIGCHPSHVRRLIKSGKLKGVLRKAGESIVWWELESSSVRAYSKRPQTGGWPRGPSRP